MAKDLLDCRVFTLREMLGSQTRLVGEVEILNECNESIMRLCDVEQYVAPIANYLKDELLDREVLSYGMQFGAMTLVVRGVEDAE